MPTIIVFTNEAIAKIRRTVKANLKKYEQPDAFVLNPQMFPGEKPTTSTLLTLKDFELTAPSSAKDKSSTDCDNAITLHKGLQLNRLQARDPRLWGYLTHVHFWKYMHKRWGVDTEKKDNPVTYIRSHYLINGSDSRALIRNGIAGLWWSAHLTFDSKRDDPYELTKVLFRQLDIASSLLERSLGRVPTLTRSFLEFLDKHREIYVEPTKGRFRVRALAKYLNQYGGFSVLDVLNKTQITQLLETKHAELIKES